MGRTSAVAEIRDRIARSLQAPQPDRRTWSQRIRARELVNVTALCDQQGISERRGMVMPTALTRAVWDDCVAWSVEAERRKGNPGLNETDRLDMLIFACASAVTHQGGPVQLSPVEAILFRIPQDGIDREWGRVALRVELHEGDHEDHHVVTISHMPED